MEETCSSELTAGFLFTFREISTIVLGSVQLKGVASPLNQQFWICYLPISFYVIELHMCKY